MPENTSTQNAAGGSGSTGTNAEATATPVAEPSIYDKYFSSKIPGAEAANGDAVVAGDSDASAERGAQALIAELSAMRTAISELKAAGHTAEAAAASAQVKSFMDHLKSGDMAGAEAALTAKIESQIANKVIGEATRKALVVANAQNELAAFGAKLLNDYPELTPVQDLVDLGAQKLISQAREDGIIREGDIGAYVSAYKSALRQSADRVRSITAGAKSAGAQNATVRNTEVLRTGTIPPNAQTRDSALQAGASNGAGPTTLADQVIADRDFLAARTAQRNKLRNMG